MATHSYYTGKADEAVKSKKSARKFFYLDDKLYRQLRFDNGQDLMVAWCYDDAVVANLPLSYVKRKRRPTFTINQAAAMLNRSRMSINHLYLFGVVDKPKRSYTIDKPDRRDYGTFRLAESDVFRLHSYFAQSMHLVKYSRSKRPLPSRMQLANIMKYEKIPYVRKSDGDFVPVWDAPSIEDW
jgi:hypothetical protein